MSAHHRPGPHELGQNHLTDRRIVDEIVALVADRDLPVVEWAAGTGAITRGLARLGRPVEAVELDPRSLEHLRRIAGPHVRVTDHDILRHAPPTTDHDLVANVPFALTTPVLRRLLRLGAWQRSVLVTQWEVARKRAGVGGATLLTAQWWPWYRFTLQRRIAASAFRPRPSVDAGLLVVDRRPRALVPERPGYQAWVRSVFQGRGRGVPDILVRSGIPRSAVRSWASEHQVTERSLPRDLTAQQWAAGHALATGARRVAGRGIRR
ncbi:23S ribosomal RNA methyltransferase Erm [Pseudonocardia endophytica]|uniref:23S rRNA (Adenine-N6)-dimethyltransferase n=1 Tax=Pseudonocardia endophytica TaxID=401976 RepID=A0A4R1HIR6_PSEEN|nr:23S ribosomal RNA methyltransferase Erm [Pseudonocardia endophytica]TCK20200.1 23S rRNA (adenine-N6)-dimethyltransferase [Pseudonocardia endophytica]